MHVVGVLFPIAVNFAGGFLPVHSGITLETPGSIADFAAALFLPILEGYKWSVGVLWFLTSLCFVQILAYWSLRRFPAIAVLAVADGGDRDHKLSARAIPYEDLGARLGVLRAGLPVLAMASAVALLGGHSAHRRHHIHRSAQSWLLLQFRAVLRKRSLQRQDVHGQLRLFAGVLPVLARGFARRRVPERGASQTAALRTFLPIWDRKSLELFFINGFVATFLFGFFWEMEWPHLTVFHYMGLFIGSLPRICSRSRSWARCWHGSMRRGSQ